MTWVFQPCSLLCLFKSIFCISETIAETVMPRSWRPTLLWDFSDLARMRGDLSKPNLTLTTCNHRQLHSHLPLSVPCKEVKNQKFGGFQNCLFYFCQKMSKIWSARIFVSVSVSSIPGNGFFVSFDNFDTSGARKVFAANSKAPKTGKNNSSVLIVVRVWARKWERECETSLDTKVTQ